MDNDWEIIPHADRRSVTPHEPKPPAVSRELQIALDERTSFTPQAFIDAWNDTGWTHALALAHAPGELSSADAFLQPSSAEIILTPLSDVHPDALLRATLDYLRALLEGIPYATETIALPGGVTLLRVRRAA